ncbi:MAG: hypothetical protein U0359_25060 [Byssovorax sp.]
MPAWMPDRMFAVLLACLVAACNQGPDRPDQSPPPRPAGSIGPASASSASGGPGAPGDAPSASASAAAPTGLGGTWEGRYEAKKGTLEMPPKVKDKARAADDGKAMSGPGKVEVTVSPAGELRGKASGALGEATLTGKVDVEGGVLRASWFPVDPTAQNAMTGVLIGMLKDGKIHGQIRVAGPDATLVREAEIDLARK